MATPRPPTLAAPPRFQRYSITFKENTSDVFGFHDCDTAEEVRAWVNEMLGAPGKRPTTRTDEPTKIILSPESSEALVRAFLTSPAPAGMEPGADTLKGRLLGYLRSHGPTDLATLHAAIARPSSAISGRLSELVAAGRVLRREGRYEAAPVAAPTTPDPDADPLAARVLECLGHQPMRLSTLAQYTSCRIVDLSPVVTSLVKAGRVVDKGGLFRLATSPTPPKAAVKSSPVRAAPSPPPARKGKP